MPTGAATGGDLDLRTYAAVARRRWRVLVLLALLVPSISALISLRREASFAASSEVLVKRQNLAASLTPGQVPYTDAQTAERVVDTQVQLARVPDLADRVIAAAGLAGTHTAADLLESSTVTAKPGTDILVFRVEWPVPATARSLAGLYADQFTTYRRQLDTTELETLATGVRDQLASIDSTVAGNTSLSTDLRDKLRQIQTLQALQTSSAVVVRRPATATEVGPTPITMVTGGLLLGLLLGGGLAFLLESLDTRLRRSADVAAILGLPLLARLPAPPSSLRKRAGLVVMEDPESPAAEAFAFLRTNLSFANMASGAKVIMFGSAMEQEGKSTTIANLAVALARAGSRVVLVDLDYRRPTLHSFFRVPRVPGITEVASGRADLDQVLHQVPIAHESDDPDGGGPAQQASLQVLPVGGIVHGIDVDAMVDVLDRLRSHADVVLVDAPPLLLVGEALALSARVDALLVIARLNHVRRPMLEELRRAFDAAPVRVLGVVATAATEEPGYSHYYRRKAYTTAPDTESRPATSASAPVPAAAPKPSRLPTGGEGPSAPAPAPAPVAPSAPRSEGEAVLGDEATNGSRPAGGRSGPRTSPPSAAVQPRRSWARPAGERPSPPDEGAEDDAVGSNGEVAPALLTGREKDAEGPGG